MRPAPALSSGRSRVIATERLGALQNIVTTSDRAPPWTFGVGELFRNLAQRGLLPAH